MTPPPINSRILNGPAEGSFPEGALAKWTRRIKTCHRAVAGLRQVALTDCQLGGPLHAHGSYQNLDSR